jgi:hypothetical protein
VHELAATGCRAVVVPVGPRPVLSEREHVLGETGGADIARGDPPPGLQQLGVEPVREVQVSDPSRRSAAA